MNVSKHTLAGFAAAIAAIVIAFWSIATQRGEDKAFKMTSLTIGGKNFELEVADTPSQRLRGLSGQQVVPFRSGMIFVFEKPNWQSYVMRDCSVALDLIYLDQMGRVDSLHHMVPEAPRSASEQHRDAASEAAYDARLKSYVSSGAVLYAIELRGGSIDELQLRVGDTLPIDKSFTR